MKFHPTPLMLERAYDYLRATPPFAQDKLPAPETVEFRVTRHKNLGGEFSTIDGTPCICISVHAVGSTRMLIEYMAHEMVHFVLWQRGEKTHHGKPFQRYAERVCRYHGFDPKQF